MGGENGEVGCDEHGWAPFLVWGVDDLGTRRFIGGEGGVGQWLCRHKVEIFWPMFVLE